MALIYIVEDDKSIQEIEIFALTGSGYNTVGFDCATDFYKALETSLPDLIIFDIMLPDEDGLSIVQKLRLRHDTLILPNIIVSAKTTEIVMVKGQDIDTDDYMYQPFV